MRISDVSWSHWQWQWRLQWRQSVSLRTAQTVSQFGLVMEHGQSDLTRTTWNTMNQLIAMQNTRDLVIWQQFIEFHCVLSVLTF